MKVNRWARVTLTSTLRPRYLVIITSHHGSRAQHFHTSKKPTRFIFTVTVTPDLYTLLWCIDFAVEHVSPSTTAIIQRSLRRQCLTVRVRRLELLSYRTGAYSVSYTFTNKYTSLHTHTNTESTAPYVWHMPPWAISAYERAWIAANAQLATSVYAGVRCSAMQAIYMYSSCVCECCSIRPVGRDPGGAPARC